MAQAQEPAVPLQFLVGLTRLIAIYFALRCLDGMAATVTTFYMYREMNPGLDSTTPSAWAIYLPSVATYVTLLVVVWLMAPAICRIATSYPAFTRAEGFPGFEMLNWSEVLIFLVGTLFVGWGLTRLADGITPIFQARLMRTHHEFLLSDAVSFFSTAVLMGFGAVLMFRFSSVHRWMHRRKRRAMSATQSPEIPL
jgi:hypothetical protein